MGIDIELGDDTIPELRTLKDTNLDIVKIEIVWIKENPYFIFTINDKGRYRSSGHLLAHSTILRMKDFIETTGKGVRTYFTTGRGGKFVFDKPRE